MLLVLSVCQAGDENVELKKITDRFDKVRHSVSNYKFCSRDVCCGGAESLSRTTINNPDTGAVLRRQNSI